MEVAVGEEREVNSILVAIGGDLLRLVKLADYTDEVNALLVERVIKFGQHRPIPLGQWAGGMEKGETDGFTVAAEQVSK